MDSPEQIASKAALALQRIEEYHSPKRYAQKDRDSLIKLGFNRLYKANTSKCRSKKIRD